MDKNIDELFMTRSKFIYLASVNISNNAAGLTPMTYGTTCKYIYIYVIHSTSLRTTGVVEVRVVPKGCHQWHVQESNHHSLFIHAYIYFLIHIFLDHIGVRVSTNSNTYLDMAGMHVLGIQDEPEVWLEVTGGVSISVSSADKSSTIRTN